MGHLVGQGAAAMAEGVEQAAHRASGIAAFSMGAIGAVDARACAAISAQEALAEPCAAAEGDREAGRQGVDGTGTGAANAAAAAAATVAGQDRQGRVTRAGKRRVAGADIACCGDGGVVGGADGSGGLGGSGGSTVGGAAQAGGVQGGKHGKRRKT